MLKQMITTICLLLTLITVHAEETNLNWFTNMEEAKSEASNENKFILMSFQGSDWCANCMRLEKILFENPDFQSFAKEYLVLLKLDFPAKKKNKLPEHQQTHNDALAEKYNAKGIFPLVVIFDAGENLLGEMAYPKNSAAEYIASIRSLIGA